MPAILCLGCRYPLAGLAEQRCPECGREFDPRDPSTVLIMSRFMLAPSLSRPPGAAMWAAVVLSAILAVVEASGDPPILMLGGMAGVGWAILAGVVAARVVARLCVPLSRHRLRVSARRFWWPTLSMVALALAAWLLCRSEVPWRARLMLSLPLLNAAADRAEAAPGRITDIEGWIGPVHAIAAFKVEHEGVTALAIETGRRFETRLYGRFSGLIRVRGPISEYWKPAYNGDSLELRPFRGDWYLWQWTDLTHAVVRRRTPPEAP